MLFSSIQKEIKKARKKREFPHETRLRAMADPDRMWALRMKFVEQAKKYFGVPYKKKYWKPEDPEYHSKLFMDCCALVRRCVRDLRKDFGFKIGPWNQAYQHDTLPITIDREEDMKPGDLVFISAIYYSPKSKKQRHNLTHVEIWLGDGPKTIGARWNNGKVRVFDSYRFTAKSYHSEKYIFKSIDTWLMGICRSHCPEHTWKTRNEIFKPEKKSIFNPEAEKAKEPEAASSVIEESDESAGDTEDELVEEFLKQKERNSHDDAKDNLLCKEESNLSCTDAQVDLMPERDMPELIGLCGSGSDSGTDSRDADRDEVIVDVSTPDETNTPASDRMSEAETEDVIAAMCVLDTGHNASSLESDSEERRQHSDDASTQNSASSTNPIDGTSSHSSISLDNDSLARQLAQSMKINRTGASTNSQNPQSLLGKIVPKPLPKPQTPKFSFTNALTIGSIPLGSRDSKDSIKKTRSESVLQEPSYSSQSIPPMGRVYSAPSTFKIQTDRSGSSHGIGKKNTNTNNTREDQIHFVEGCTIDLSTRKNSNACLQTRPKTREIEDSTASTGEQHAEHSDSGQIGDS